MGSLCPSLAAGPVWVLLQHSPHRASWWYREARGSPTGMGQAPLQGQGQAVVWTREDVLQDPDLHKPGQ